MGIALVVALSICLRVAWVLAVPGKPVGDFAMYLESAAHLVEHGAFDDRFVFMPGYVLLVALVQLLGGGSVAVKLVGAVAAGGAVFFVHGITTRLWNPRAALVAALLYAIWPGAIAVAGVTGTDMPAAVLVCAALYGLARWGGTRPWRAALVFGSAMGIAATVRAVALPLTGLSVLYFLAAGQGWRRSLARALAATAIAFVVLAPWGIRNRLKYGEWVFTDSHGGLTALVGSYPNSDGHFTRALDRTFRDVTGMTWLEPPHREADATAYALSRTWTAFDRPYAIGLSIERAQRLLSDERSLLYWPLYRPGVLTGERLAFFARWRRQIENLVDGFWWLLVPAGLAGFAIAAARRDLRALVPLAFAAAQGGVYVLYFAESRYHLPIAVLWFPSAAGALVCLFDVVRRAVRERRLVVEHRGAAIAALSTPAAALVLWSVLVPSGHRLVDRHRFAVHSCRVVGQPRFCLWKRTDRAREAGSPVRGVFDGVGLEIAGRVDPGAVTRIVLPPGRYLIRATLDLGPSDALAPTAGAAHQGIIHLRGGASPDVQVPLVQLSTGESRVVEFTAEAGANTGDLDVALWFESAAVAPPPGSRVWLTGLTVAPG